ncbi:MAG TPA: hypothetical protein VFK15_09795 [Burkholderiales bacterium]|jgi:hypothetical protein|nr:hypothetical protein [Burkholderiales bacterium]
MCPVFTSPPAERRSQRVSEDPQSFIAYAPRGFGLLCALVYAAHGNDVDGWWIGPVDGAYRPSYFELADYFSPHETAFYTTRGGDLYGGWVCNYDARYPDLEAPIPVDEALVHALERMQFVFAQEWLTFSEDGDADAEAALYRNAELAHQEVNVKFRKLNRLAKDQPVWIYRSARLDGHLLRRLARNWPLQYWGIER